MNKNYFSKEPCLPEGFNPKEGGSLDLRLLKELPKDFNPKVENSLDLTHYFKEKRK